MTKEQAFKNLSLPADADIETIRMRFAARYTLSDAQYDRTLTNGMKAIHEQHLRELEQAYKVATDNPIIADMGALLSLGKGYVEENSTSIGGDDNISTDEALAFFALYPHDTPVLAEQRCTQYVVELEEAMEQVGLEASKEPYRREIAKAETSLQIAMNYLLANQMLASQQEEAAETAGEHEPLSDLEIEEVDNPVYAAPTASKAANKRKYGFIAAAAMALLAIGIWVGKSFGTDEDDKPVANVQAHTETETAPRPAPNKRNNSAQPEVAETPVTVPRKMEEAQVARQSDLSPKAVVESILKQYAKGYKITVSDAQLLLEGKQTYRLPIRNIDHLDDQGKFVSVFGSSLYVDDQPKRTSEGLRLSITSQKDRDRLITEIRKIAPARKSAKKNNTSTAVKPTTEIPKEETVSSKAETESSVPLTVKKDTEEPASNKPAGESKNSTQKNNAEQKKSPDTKPTEKNVPAENEVEKSAKSPIEPA